MNKVYELAIKFLSVDTVCSIIAKGIAKILENSSKKGGSTWSKSKKMIQKIHLWCGLFLEVYDDDTLTKEEEQKIADAIKNQTNVKKIVTILKK